MTRATRSAAAEAHGRRPPRASRDVSRTQSHHDQGLDDRRDLFARLPAARYSAFDWLPFRDPLRCTSHLITASTSRAIASAALIAGSDFLKWSQRRRVVERSPPTSSSTAKARPRPYGAIRFNANRSSLVPSTLYPEYRSRYTRRLRSTPARDRVGDGEPLGRIFGYPDHRLQLSHPGYVFLVGGLHCGGRQPAGSLNRPRHCRRSHCDAGSDCRVSRTMRRLPISRGALRSNRAEPSACDAHFVALRSSSRLWSQLRPFN